MYSAFYLIGKTCMFVAVILFCHDLLNYLEFERFGPTTIIELYQLFWRGYVTNTYTTGSSFFDQVVSWPAFLVFGIFGVTLFIVFRSFAND